MATQKIPDTQLLRSGEFAPFQERLREGADLSKTNWFRVGGPAEWLFKPEDTQDLSAFLSLLPQEIPVTILGVGSNVIVRDAGIGGVVIKLGRGFTSTVILNAVKDLCKDPSAMPQDDIYISSGAAALDVNVARFACEQGVAGLEFLSGIPGTIGGAVCMNGGAYGSDTSQILIEAEIVERDGRICALNNQELGFSYRHSSLPKDAIVTKAVLRAAPGDSKMITARMEDIQKSREETQPIRSRTGGSTFKNPENHKAWELIEKAGCRGLSIGGAQVSEKHCNFLINTGNATAADLENLGEEVIKRVREKTGVTLEWEIKRVGKV